MLSFLKKKSKKSVQPVIEEISSTIKTVVDKPQKEESFIERIPYKVISEVVAPVKPTEKYTRFLPMKNSQWLLF